MLRRHAPALMLLLLAGIECTECGRGTASFVFQPTWKTLLCLSFCFPHIRSLCRPAASDVMPGAASTAIPAHVEDMGNDHTRYLVSVKPALAPTHSSILLGSRGSRRSSLLQVSRQPFDDVKLGPLLGKGGYGRVYRAVWNGAAVACKVLPTAQMTLCTTPMFMQHCIRVALLLIGLAAALF